MSAPPTIPQRPARSQNPPVNVTDTTSPSLAPPQVPPRPAGRADRSISPNRAAYTRSPLNDLPLSKPSMNGSGLSPGEQSLGRKPSVPALPGLGQEGDEYASINEPNLSPTQTRNIAGDLPLHAPKAGISKSHQTSIATLTRTDSNDAAAAGIGQPRQEHSESMKVPPRPSPGGRTISRDAVSRSRPESVYESDREEHGIPHIGPYVPMYPDAGDVQAPSPAPFSPQPTGVGFFNDASRSGPSSAHGRRKSAQMHLPPGSYGLHGHGVMNHDQFETAWYQKHPEERAKEAQGAYGPTLTPRGEFSMSSEELNKIVRDSASRQSNFGTNHSSIAIPPDSIGYQASEEYASRMASPRPAGLAKTRTHSVSQLHAESPLRKASFPAEMQDKDQEEDDDVIHIDPPIRRQDKIHGGGYDPPTEDLGPRGGNTAEHGGYIREDGTGTPILASDEIARNPAAEYMLPAVEPAYPKGGDGEYMPHLDAHGNVINHNAARERSRSREARRSRPTSFHEGHSGLSRWASYGINEGVGTPLEDVEEYEPLFKDEEGNEKPLTAADRFKRPELEKQRFPSQDIWEDTPDSLQLSSQVTHEQEPEDTKQSPVTRKAPAAAFETPEQEAKRKGEITEKERLSYLTDPSKGFAKPKFSEGVQSEMRPNMRHRFPSQDIWEDSPDSLQLETTINPAEQVPSAEVKSPTTGKGVPAENDLARSFGAIDPALAVPFDKSQPVPQPQVPARPGQGETAAPSQTHPAVPPRPSKKVDQVIPEQVPDLPTQANQPPNIPERPKPQVPARPAKHVAQPRDTSSTTEQIMEAGANKDATGVPAPAPKAKPSVPSKVSALRAGFMDQLNNRLALGPHAPPKPQPAPEAEEEKAPLTDARRGRAKGPARRTAVPAAAEPAQTSSATSARFSISTPIHHWSIDPATPHEVRVGQHSPAVTSSGSFSEKPVDIAGDVPSSVMKDVQTMASVPPTTEDETLESKNDEDLASKPLLGGQSETAAPESTTASTSTGAPESESVVDSISNTIQNVANESGLPASISKTISNAANYVSENLGGTTSTEGATETSSAAGKTMVSSAAQTGQVEMSSGGEKTTAYDDGAAQKGSVVLKGDEEEVV